MKFLMLISLPFLLISCSQSSKRVSDRPLKVYPVVDLERYEGLWYEIARFPAFFQEGCVGVTAEYELRDDGKVNVLNTCRKNSLDGEIDTAEGVARVVDKETNAKLKVRFDGFFASLFEGDYWIIDLANDYSYAIVSEPKGRYLWILSRNPQMDEALYDAIVESLEMRGFLVEQLQKTPQEPS